MSDAITGDFTEEFIQAIDQFLENSNKLVILGIGNEDNGDDAVGLYITNILQNTNLPEWVVIFYCERVPEHFLGKIEKEKPNRIMVLDAANMEEVPGAIAVFSKDMVSEGYHFSTHTLSLTMLEEFLKPVVPNLIALYVGIQPKQTEFLTEMCQECKIAAEEFAELLIERIHVADIKRG